MRRPDEEKYGSKYVSRTRKQRQDLLAMIIPDIYTLRPVMSF